MVWRRAVLWVLALAVLGTAGLLLWPKSAGPVENTQSDSASSNLLQPPLAGEPVLTADPPPVFAQTAAVIDAGSGRVLVSLDPHKSVPIASTTKVMSSIVFLNTRPNLDEQVTVSQAAASQIGSLMGLAAGERLSLRDLLAGSLIVSGNDAAYQIAEQTGGLEKFVLAMNETAATAGLRDSKFFDPAGLDDAGRSSAYDLAMMLRYALTFDTFRTIVSSPVMDVNSSTQTYRLSNSNRLVRGDEPLYLPDSLGGKTGFTPDAGHCLVAAARRDGHVLIAAVLASDNTAPDGSAEEARRLLTWTFDHTNWQ